MHRNEDDHQRLFGAAGRVDRSAIDKKVAVEGGVNMALLNEQLEKQEAEGQAGE